MNVRFQKERKKKEKLEVGRPFPANSVKLSRKKEEEKKDLSHMHCGTRVAKHRFLIYMLIAHGNDYLITSRHISLPL